MFQHERINPGSPVQAKHANFPQIDAIRVLAMLAIFTQHLWLTVIPNPETMLQKNIQAGFHKRFGRRNSF